MIAKATVSVKSPEGTQSKASKESDPSYTKLAWITIVAAFAFIALATFFAGRGLKTDDFFSKVPETVEGLTMFAIFFVGAQAVERVLEPFGLVLGVKKKAEAEAKVEEASKTENQAAQETAVEDAAQMKADAEAIAKVKAIAFWGVATILGIIVSALFKLQFFHLVGIQTGSVYLEILGTGLILGAGTKPLHDLVALIEKKKEAAAAQAGAGTAG